jgi:hypothetical protein
MRTRVLFSLALPFLLAGWLPAQINAPTVGVARFSDRSVHAVFGLHEAFIVSAQAIGSAEAISFSDAGGLLATGAHIQLIGPSLSVLAEYESSESKPLLNIDGGLTTAIVWLPSEHALLRWNGKSFISTEVKTSLPGRVTCVRVHNPNVAKLLLVEAGGVVSEATISLDTGHLIGLDILPGVAAPAFAQHSFILFHSDRGLEIKSANGALRTLPVSAPDLTFERMSSDWVHLSSAATKQNWVLHLNERTLELSELPALPSPSLGSLNTTEQEVHK